MAEGATVDICAVILTHLLDTELIVSVNFLPVFIFRRKTITRKTIRNIKTNKETVLVKRNCEHSMFFQPSKTYQDSQLPPFFLLLLPLLLLPLHLILHLLLQFFLVQSQHCCNESITRYRISNVNQLHLPDELTCEWVAETSRGDHGDIPRCYFNVIYKG